MTTKIGKATIYNMDCMELLKATPDKFYDLAIVDPDFGLNDKLTNGGTWASKYKKGDGNLGGIPNNEYFNNLFRVSKNQIIWGGNYFALPANRAFIIWDKVSHMPTMADCEYAWLSFDSNAKIYKHPRNSSENRIHICQKPIKLYEWLLTNYAKEGDKILDTHLGSMSSVIACLNLGFEITGCELDKDYYEAGIKRVEQSQKQQRMFA
jgi:site-specific DNA-methyltransferase (adenine-specific)